MTLSRRDLEEHRMRAIYMAAVDPDRALSDEALADLRCILAQNRDRMVGIRLRLAVVNRCFRCRRGDRIAARAA
jgi:hypothetical protein